MRIIDTHQHLLYPDRFQYAWCDGIPALKGRRFGTEEYAEASRGTGIEAALFMEVDVDEAQMKNEAEFFLKFASGGAGIQSAQDRLAGNLPSFTGPPIAGVIAASRPEHDGFKAYVDSIAHAKLKGLRRIFHTQSPALIESTTVARNLKALAQRRLTFDLCALPSQLRAAQTLLRAVPNLQFILDHCGIPDIRANALDPWRAHIRELAQFPNLACKISGVVAYCDPARASADAIRPFVEHCIECFGWDRVLFGGDWPVCNLTSSLANWVAMAKEIVARESLARQEQLFWRNAVRIYRLDA